LGFQVMFNQSFDVRTQGVGGTVTGRVVNVLGRPMKGVKVCLGDYYIYTPDDGKFEFKNVPHGEYQLGIDTDTLPANFKQCCATQNVDIDNRTRITANFQLIPLGSVSGRVYNDRNGDGRYVEGEGVAGVIVKLGDMVTISDSDGQFGLYNVDPGRYQISVDAARLPEGLAPVETDKVIDLRADQSITGIEMKLAFHDKPVEYQELK
jgi:hypothetical protein